MLRAKLKRLEPAAIQVLIDALQCRAEDMGEAIKAATIVLAYRYGKPSESVELTGADGEALKVTISINGVKHGEGE